MNEIKGYRHLPKETVDQVNHNKEVEENLLRLTDQYILHADIDKRWMSIARTHFEEGFMALNRSLTRPQ